MTEREVRNKIVRIFTGWAGKKESDGSHESIIDIYNGHSPLARGYRVQYTDAWCATAASAAAIAAGYTDIIPTECSCEKMIALAKEMGIWVEDDAYVPDSGDYVLYDWQDNGIGDCTGAADHIGMAVIVSDGKIRVVEGNINDSVGFREIAVNGRNIRGFITPNYAALADSQTTPKPAAPAESSGTVYTVKSGDTLSKIAKAHNTSIDAILAANKGKYPKMTKDYIVVGWKLSIGGAAAAPAESSGTVYTVKSGDTLSKIAKAHNTSIDAILVANKGEYPKITKDYIVVGWKLKV